MKSDEWHKTMIQALKSERNFLKSCESIYSLLAVVISVLVILLMNNFSSSPVDAIAIILNFSFLVLCTTIFVLLIIVIEKKENRLIKKIRTHYTILLNRKK